MKSNLQQNVVESILELLWFFDTSPQYSFFNAFKKYDLDDSSSITN